MIHKTIKSYNRTIQTTSPKLRKAIMENLKKENKEKSDRTLKQVRGPLCKYSNKVYWRFQ